MIYYTELQKERQHVVTTIRSNQQLEKDANSMDIKIGLLVKNRITLDVSIISQCTCYTLLTVLSVCLSAKITFQYFKLTSSIDPMISFDALFKTRIILKKHGNSF